MNLHRALKLGWLLLAAIVLAVVLAGYDGRPNSDIEQFLIGSMIVLSFPIGFLVAFFFSLIYAGLGSCCGLTVTVSYPSLLVEWFAFASAGYFQWFVLAPWLQRRWRSKRTDPSTH